MGAPIDPAVPKNLTAPRLSKSAETHPKALALLERAFPKSRVAPRPVDIESYDHLFTLSVSILRRPAVLINVFGHETLAMIISTAWEQAPKSIRRNEDTKVMLSEVDMWEGIWTEILWKDIVRAAGQEIEPPVYTVVLEFEE